MQACRLLLPGTHPSSVVSSVLFEPISRSLALTHSDSSILLYPPSPSSSSSPFPSFQNPISIPPPASSASFLRLDGRPGGRENDAGRVLFLTVLPERRGGARTMVKAWILGKKDGVFVPALLRLKRKESESSDFGLALDLDHGFSVRIGGTVNFFALHSLSERKIWVVGAKLGNGDGEGSVVVDFVKCAIVDCVLPIYTMRVLGGCMILGVDNGVRVFPLRGLVKGRRKETGKSNRSKSDGSLGNREKSDERVVGINDTDDSKKMSLVNNLKRGDFPKTEIDSGLKVHENISIRQGASNCNGNYSSSYSAVEDISKLENGGLRYGNFTRNGINRIMDIVNGNLSFGSLVMHENGEHMLPKIHHLHLNSVTGDDVWESAVGYMMNDTGNAEGILPRLSSQGIRMPSIDSELIRVLADAESNVAFKSLKVLNSRAVSIHSLSQRRFLVLDSLGNLHLLRFFSAAHAPFPDKASVASSSMCLSPLQCSVKVHMLAVLSDASGAPTIWVSDGCHSLYCMSLPDMDVPADETRREPEKKLLHLTSCQAIFASERIQEIIPIDGNSALILGQENIFAYSVPGS